MPYKSSTQFFSKNITTTDFMSTVRLNESSTSTLLSLRCFEQSSPDCFCLHCFLFQVIRIIIVNSCEHIYIFSFRSENGKLKRHNEELHQRLMRAMSRLKDLEDQTEQHSRVQEKMKERLKMMDDHAQHQGQQVHLIDFGLPIPMYRKRYCSTPKPKIHVGSIIGISCGVSISRMLKFYVKVFM